ncbi:hypothetical protein IEO21_01670 [Rhodonia placenta]|uniref:DUF6534 domain-containing protein n=1 Tax=Rhodonia placenta TaxID=104341 RepID=A0A8H7P9C2_9APHY|nr:hypothetical protein IEO21_01670 [Postia placenta]
MAPEIRFNTWGIPYLVEFGNVGFRPRPRPASPALSLNPSYTTCGSTATLLNTVGSSATASSETLQCLEGDSDESKGLYIRFASHRYRPPHKLSNSRLLRLKHRIAKAVMAAGMDSSPAGEKEDPIRVHQLSRASYGSIQSTDSLPEEGSGSLFRGTYGQVMSALQSVGLVTTPCKESGVDEGQTMTNFNALNYQYCKIFIVAGAVPPLSGDAAFATLGVAADDGATPYRSRESPFLRVGQTGSPSGEIHGLYEASHQSQATFPPSLGDPAMVGIDLHLNNTMGCAFVGVLFAVTEYPKDKLFLKILHQFMWYWLVTNHGNPVNLANLPRHIQALTIAIVQMTIYAVLTGRWYRIPYSLALIPASIQTITAFITDMIITLSLCAILWGSKTGFKRTETLIATLIVYAIHRGIFTGLVQLAHFATFISTLHQPKLYWMIWHVPGSKIYVNSLLAVLNVRHHLSEAGNEIETHISVELEAVSHQSLSYNQTRSRRLSRATASHTRIMLTKEVVRDTEVISDPEQPGVSRKMSPPW